MANISVSPSFYEAGAINRKSNLLYALDSLNNVASIIDGYTNKVVMGITFNVEPSMSGDIYCNGNKISASPISLQLVAGICFKYNADHSCVW
jgi:hypothetical protein